MCVLGVQVPSDAPSQRIKRPGMFRNRRRSPAEQQPA